MTTSELQERRARRNTWHKERRGVRKLSASDVGHLFYQRECLLPCLELQAIVKERGRDELGDLVLLVLGLLADGVRSVESLSRLTGVHARTLEQVLTEQEGSSLIRRSSQGPVLTDLGEESLALGIPMRLVQRSLLYCALACRLLPREAYSLELRPLSSLDAKFIDFKEVLPDPQHLVDLRGVFVDIADVRMKRDVNLPDEALAIQSISSYRPAYVRAVLCITGSIRPKAAWVIFGSTPLEYPLEAVKPWMRHFNPDEFSSRHQKSVGEVISDSLRVGGAVLQSPLKLDTYGSPVVVLSNATDEWLSSSLGLEDPWVLICGTSAKPPRPISRFPMRDVLNGHTMSIYMKNDKLEDDIYFLRNILEFVDYNYFSIPLKQREYGLHDFLAVKLSTAERARARSLVRRFNIRHALNWFREAPEGSTLARA